MSKKIIFYLFTLSVTVGCIATKEHINYWKYEKERYYNFRGNLKISQEEYLLLINTSSDSVVYESGDTTIILDTFTPQRIFYNYRGRAKSIRQIKKVVKKKIAVD
ncbi:MAG: hypothetical protein ACFB10_02245 [Salibacteraceae bacterium]